MTELDKEIEKYRNQLYYSLDKKAQSLALDWFSQNKDKPEIIKVLVKALRQPQIQVKSKVFLNLFLIEKVEVFEELTRLVGESREQFKEEIVEYLTRNPEVRDNLFSRLEEWKRNYVNKAPLICAVVRLFSVLGVKESLDWIAKLLSVKNEPIQISVLEAIKDIVGTDSSAYIVSHLGSFGKNVALKALEILEKFKDNRIVLPLLYFFVNSPEEIKKKILEILKQYRPSLIDALITAQLAKDREKFLECAIIYYEATNNIEKLNALKSKYNYTPVLNADVKNVRNVIVITLGGMLTIQTIPRLQKIVQVIANAGYKNFVLDCDKVVRISRDGLKFLASLAEQFQSAQGAVNFVNLKVLNAAEKSLLLKGKTEFQNLNEAIETFDDSQSEKTVRLTQDMFARGTEVEVTLKQGDKKETKLCKVIGLEKKHLFLSWEFSQDINTYDITGNWIDLVLVRDNEVLTCHARVLKQNLLPQPNIEVFEPSMAKVMSRRRHVRIETSIPVVVYKLLSPKVVSNVPIQGICKNLSVGGVMIEATESLEEKSLLIISFSDEKLKVSKVLGKIVRKLERAEANRVSYEYGISFVTVFEQDREKITQYIFNQISQG